MRRLFGMYKELCKTVGLELPEKEEKWYLEYYITQTGAANLPNHAQLLTFGVEVVKSRMDEAGKLVSESKWISDVCCCESKMRYFINKLAHNTVTPVALRDVLEDLLIQDDSVDIVNSSLTEIKL